ncbi:hypothetical protein SAMN04487936_104336 [Halobacillus dabanensis]|uniref:WYL domain-containing protein n=1 Tax=Halobacillus dabanensis TaxID=240302 RepID=A0A1I3UHK6_HALDA|nr:hypothetical protein [Halobacillus dabanensis]SFJ82540.1 hypothetical protein SAMN04487936_104336 [Halobacillus dabanensis]
MNGALNRAVDTKEHLEMIYVDGRGSMSKRRMRVVEVRENHVLAYCYNRMRVRSFRKNGIMSVYPYKERKDVVNG